MRDLVEVRVGPELRKGLCTFATRDIEQGTRIMTDKPIMTMGYSADPNDIYLAFHELENKDRYAYLRLSYRQHRQREYITRINKDDLVNVYNFCESKGDTQAYAEQAAKVLAIFDDNQVQLQYDSVCDLALRIARINHSCIPNVAVAWNSALETYTVHALRDIKQSEEILYSYVYIPEPRDKRLERLQMWEMVCKCWACDFENAGLEEQKERAFGQDKSRPILGRRNTGELNDMLWGHDTAQCSENRRVQWQLRNAGLNKISDDRDAFGQVSTYEAMFRFLGNADEFMEEKVRLYRGLTREYDAGRDKDDLKWINAYGDAVHFSKICYGEDGDITDELMAFVRRI